MAARVTVPVSRLVAGSISLGGCRAGKTLAIGVFLMLSWTSASAGKLLDYLRNYDLNDYALGVSMSVSQKPYLGTGNSTILYPYLTSFEHSAFTDDWFLLRGGDIGVRYVSAANWEMGVVGRVQTLGFGGTETDGLRGMDARRATLEAGPILGYRGWPVHMQLRAYWEILDRHSGMTSEFEVSLPRKFARGYIIPSLRVTYLSDAYSRYYYGVADYEAAPGRPAYVPGAAVNTWAGIVMGYELTPKWLLSTTFGLEYLDDNVSASPIVDEDSLWSVNVGLAYNADIFNVARSHGAETARFELRLSSLFSSTDSTLIRDSALGEPGEEIDLEEIFGVNDEQTLSLVDTFYRLAYYHRLELSYFELRRSSQQTLNRDVQFGKLELPAGTGIDVGAWSTALRMAYSYSLMRDKQKELGVSAGLSRTRFETLVSVGADGLDERLQVRAMVPTIGVYGSVALGEHWLLSADINAFALEFDRYEGYLAYLNANLERHFSNNVKAGLGFSFFGTRLESSNADVHGTFRFRHYGPKLSIALRF